MCVLFAACNDGTQNNTEQPGDGNPPSETPVDPGTETPGTGNEPGVDDPEDPAPSQPETYSVTFVAGGNVVSVVSYSENTATISEPSVPNKTGYTGAWEPYSLGAADITVNAVYTPIEYTVTFVADGETVGTAVYTVENHAIEEPSIPLKAHYTATWEEYTLTTGDLTVNAVYTLTEYTITFIADGKTVGKVGYTIEDDVVTEPQVPYKENCIGAWEDYTLSGGDLTVNAVYITTMDFALTADNSFYVVLRYNGNETEVEVPAMYNGLRVVAIAEDAFAGNTATRKITLPNSIEQIQSGAFSGCTSLADINIPANVQLIGDNAFSGCTSLQTLSMGRSVATIGANALAHCTALRSITLNEGLTAIGSFAFDGCTALTDITLPNSLNSLGTGVFRHAESLEIINIPSLITAIPNVTFQYCRSLKNIVIPATVSEIGHSAFSYCYGLESLRIEGDINTIGDSVFFNCYSLTSVYYNSSVGGDVGDENYIFYNAGTSSDGITLTLGTKAVIPDNLFAPLSDTNKPFITKMVFEDGRTSITSIYPEGLPYLKSVTIPDSVTTIEANAFNECEGALRNENGVNYADDWAISCDADIISLTLTDGVRGIANGAFDSCTDVFSLAIPENFSNLKADDFTVLTNLTHATFPMTAVSLIPKNELQNAAITSGTSLPDSAFSDCTSLISITLPTELTSIGNSAFNYCTGLTSITIPNSVISIGSYTFSDCTAEIIWGDNPSIQQIGDHAFAGYAGTTLIIPDSVTSIASGALRGCSVLESITIPFMGGSAGKTSSDTYQYPFGYIFGTSSYTGGTAVTQYYHGSSTAGITSTTNYIPSSLRSVTVTGGNLLYGAFYGCSMLTSVTIHGDMTSIEECAFYECTGLKSITIPDKVTSIGANAFYGCTEVNAVYISDITAWRKIVFNGNYATPLYYTPHLYLNGKLVTDLVISDGVTSIREQYCNGCANLTSIKIPDSVTSIGSYAFSGCTAEIIWGDNPSIWGDNPSIQQIGDHAFAGYAGTALAIPDNVTSIGSYAFYNCTGLKSVTIPDSVTSIGWSAFSGCTGLTSVTIPDSVTSIGWSAFSGCTGLTSVTIPDSVTSIESYAFDGCTSLNAVYITDLAAWCGISFGNSYANPLHYAPMYLDGELVTNLVIPNSVTSIGSYAFYWCMRLTSITIGDGVTSIGEHAFDNCTGLKSVTIPDSVTSIGSSAFSGCDGLKAVYITDLSTWCGISFGFPLANPLSYAHNLYLNGELVTDLVIPDNVTSIGNSAFSGCAGLTSITIPNSVTCIGWSAFSGCTGLKSVTIPDSVTSIGDHAFSVCSSLESITIPFVGGSAGKTPSSTYQYPFGYIFGTSYYTGGTAVQQRYRSSTSITTYSTYYIPSSLRSVTVTGGNILYGAFYNCSMLTSVTIPNSVTSIGSYAFSGCTAEIIWGDNPSIQQIGDHAFAVGRQSKYSANRRSCFCRICRHSTRHPRQRDKHRGTRLRQLHRLEVRHHPGQRDEHRRFCLLALH